MRAHQPVAQSFTGQCQQFCRQAGCFAYLAASDTNIGTRDWQSAMAEIIRTEQCGSTRQRYERAF